MPKHQKNLNGWNYATVTLPIKYRDHLSAWEAKLEITRTLDSRLPPIVLALAEAEIKREMIEEPEKQEGRKADMPQKCIWYTEAIKREAFMSITREDGINVIFDICLRHGEIRVLRSEISPDVLARLDAEYKIETPKLPKDPDAHLGGMDA